MILDAMTGEISSLIRIGDKTIAQIPYCEKMLRIGVISFENTAQSEHELIGGTGLQIAPHLPDIFEQFSTGYQPTFILYEITQQLPFTLGQ